MPTVDGLPLHPLVVHAVVVLLPLAALGTLLVVVRPAWCRAFGVPVLLLALVGVAAVPVATSTGEQLQAALPGPNPLIAVHQDRGEILLPVAITFLVLLAVAVLAGRRADRKNSEPSRATTAVGVLAAVAGLAVTGLVIWIGHAGATAVWQGVGGG